MLENRDQGQPCGTILSKVLVVQAESRRAAGPPSVQQERRHQRRRAALAARGGQRLPLLAWPDALSGADAVPGRRQPGHWPRVATRPGAWAVLTAMDLAAGHQFSGWPLFMTGATTISTRRPAGTIRETLIRRTSSMYRSRRYGQSLVASILPAKSSLGEHHGHGRRWLRPVRRSGRRRDVDRPATRQVSTNHVFPRPRRRKPRGRGLLGVRSRVHAQVHAPGAHIAWT